MEEAEQEGRREGRERGGGWTLRGEERRRGGGGRSSNYGALLNARIRRMNLFKCF